MCLSVNLQEQSYCLPSLIDEGARNEAIKCFPGKCIALSLENAIVQKCIFNMIFLLLSSLINSKISSQHFTNCYTDQGIAKRQHSD